jgi:branched-chain amino acid transport system substrate-binding protein
VGLARRLVPVAVILATATGEAPAYAEVRIGLVAPLTGPMAWAGGSTEKGAHIAVAKFNALGGVLGEPIEIITADDYCDGEQAVAAGNKLVSAGVVAVFGHQCSGAAIPASKIYASAGILMISQGATNPKLTEQGFRNVFRVVGRDDLQGRIAGDLLAERWGNKPIAILHDGQAYGKGLAEETKRRLNERGIAEAIFAAIDPGKADYWDVVEKMQAMAVEVLYFGGYPPEAGLIVRQAREHGYELQLVAGDGINSEDFGLIAGAASDGTLMTDTRLPNPEDNPELAELQRQFSQASRPPVRIYAALQVWAQAVETAGTFETEAVAAVLRGHQFDTMLGRIGFDAKGDVSGYETFVWKVWKDGKYAPVEPGELTE